jgi:polysaccharide pyruvyl transferase WcaK-like protein
LNGLTGNLRLRRLNLASPDAIIRFYASMPVTLGMRGHAQMIPFGCGNALFSIVSHDKMNFFLQDIEKPEWGADVFDRELADKAISFLANLERSWDAVARHIDAEQARFWATTTANLATIGRAAGWAAPDSST